MVLYCISILTFFLHISVPVISQKQVAINCFEETVYPIDTLSITSNLGILKKFFLSKEVIGMGEATHGTHEFFHFKSEFFKFLVVECNFRVFGIEASYGAELFVNDYVKKGIGDIQNAMKYLDWPWETEEVKDLVEWIKNYNKNKEEADKISFYGIDMQNITPGFHYLNQRFLNDSSEFSTSFRNITPLLINNSEIELFQRIDQKNPIVKDSLFRINSKLKKWIQSNETAMTEKFGKKDFSRMYLCIENFNQALKFVYGGNHSICFRDSCMASNVLEIQTIENSKMFIWAHNDHIGLKYQRMPIMGTYLKRVLNEKYYAIGFAFDHGTFNAFKGPNTMAGAIFKYFFNRRRILQGPLECRSETNGKNTLTNELRKANMQSFFIDLLSTSNPLFTTPQYYYDIGSIYMNDRHSATKIIAKEEFDGLIFIKISRSTKLLKN